MARFKPWVGETRFGSSVGRVWLWFLVWQRPALVSRLAASRFGSSGGRKPVRFLGRRQARLLPLVLSNLICDLRMPGRNFPGFGHTSIFLPFMGRARRAQSTKKAAPS